MAGMDQIQGLALQQTLSPQMQQSLNVLQAPVMELRQLVAAELQSNPALEEEPRQIEDRSRETTDHQEGMDNEWREYFAQRATAEPWTAQALEKRQHFFDSQTRDPTLQEVLLEQLAMTELPAELLPAAKAVIGNLDDNGYFREAIEEVAYLGRCTNLQAEEALERVQQLDPPGVAARNLSECLAIQLARKGEADSLESKIVKNHLDELGRRKLPEIARALGVTVSDVQAAAAAIGKLDPRPGRAFASEPQMIAVPDVFVEMDGDDAYTVRLNDDEVPSLRISNDYKDMLAQAAAGRELREYLREKIRGGRFFMKCLQQRQQTLLQIAREIVTRQKEFFDLGPSHLRPMTMGQVADAVGVHETTVSRAVSGKYMQTPRGIFEMKYFFTSGYTTEGGDVVSNESVRQAIVEIVKGESTQRPLSDQEIVEALQGRGIPIARRTVAKYREQLGILPSHLRKSY